jgi:hypothetical protein
MTDTEFPGNSISLESAPAALGRLLLYASLKIKPIV